MGQRLRVTGLGTEQLSAVNRKRGEQKDRREKWIGKQEFDRVLEFYGPRRT